MLLALNLAFIKTSETMPMNVSRKASFVCTASVLLHPVAHDFRAQKEREN